MALPVFTVRREHLDEMNHYRGPEDLTKFGGHLEIDERLGVVFGAIDVTGYIWAKVGSGIEAGESIKAGEGIEAGGGINAGLLITCEAGLSSGLRIFAGLCNEVLPSPESGRIECRWLERGQVVFGELIEAKPAQKGAE